MNTFTKKGKNTEHGTVLGFQLTARTPGEVDPFIDQDLGVADILREAGARNLTGGYNQETGYWQFSLSLIEFSPGSFIRRAADIWQRHQQHLSLNVQLHMAWADQGDEGAITRGLLLDQLDLANPYP